MVVLAYYKEGDAELTGEPCLFHDNLGPSFLPKQSENARDPRNSSASSRQEIYITRAIYKLSNKSRRFPDLNSRNIQMKWLDKPETKSRHKYREAKKETTRFVLNHD